MSGRRRNGTTLRSKIPSSHTGSEKARSFDTRMHMLQKDGEVRRHGANLQKVQPAKIINSC